MKTRFRSYEEEILEGLAEIEKGTKDKKDKNKRLDELFLVFLYCLQPAVRSKIQVFSLDGDYDLDDTIFQAIIQGKILIFCLSKLTTNEICFSKKSEIFK